MKNKTEINYKLAGSILFIDEYSAKDLGFNFEISGYPKLVYSVNGTLDEKLFIKEGFHQEPTFKFVGEHLIKEKITIKESNKKYPELFL